MWIVRAHKLVECDILNLRPNNTSFICTLIYQLGERIKTKFVDHGFTKIIEGRYERSIATLGVKSTLDKVEIAREAILKFSGEDAVQNVLHYSEVKCTLEQCLEYINNPDSWLTYDNFAIYRDFAYAKLLEAEKIIDDELPELGL